MKNGSTENYDKIFIKDLLLRCIIGVNDSERREKQDIIINVVMWADLNEAAKTDDLDSTVDYKDVNKHIIKLVEDSEFFLVETLAEEIARVCLTPKKVNMVRVTVEKPGALRFAKSVGVEIFREKKG